MWKKVIGSNIESKTLANKVLTVLTPTVVHNANG